LQLSFTGALVIKERMATKKEKARRTKEVKSIWLSPEVARRLEKAAQAEGMSQSIYIEQTLRARFKKESIQ
jgi:predicted HicB family RNase H-like nuclease